jgi:hypothetical protein
MEDRSSGLLGRLELVRLVEQGTTPRAAAGVLWRPPERLGCETAEVSVGVGALGGEVERSVFGLQKLTARTARHRRLWAPMAIDDRRRRRSQLGSAEALLPTGGQAVETRLRPRGQKRSRPPGR